MKNINTIRKGFVKNSSLFAEKSNWEVFSKALFLVPSYDCLLLGIHSDQALAFNQSQNSRPAENTELFFESRSKNFVELAAF